MNDRFRIPITNLDGQFDRFIFCDVYHKPIHFIGNAIFLTPEQSTGLKDASGKLIYEGDLLLLDPDDPLALVVWDKDIAMFCLEQEDCSYTFDNCGYTPREMEIIGNIHENPELLEDK